jgi:translation initiation factor 1
MAAKKREGIVYSTNPDFSFPEPSGEDEITLPVNRQLLYIWLDSKGRNGKTVTLIKGFKGQYGALDELSTLLKKLCGTGGSVKDGDIIIQGNFREKIIGFLSQKGYKTKKAGG